DTDGVDEVLALTGGLGANVIYTANPSPASHMPALRMAVNRGRISFFGGLPKNNSNVLLDDNIIHYKELLVSGAHGSMPQHHDLAVKLIASGRIDVKKFMTHRFGLDHILTAIAAAENYTGLRVIINP
ncbi:MAG: L-threonine 3-dehydrogenase, partial [Firmicutes bacterium]|nr:L-threonine 3-dehydrogenase [Bacillota bacterium]